MSVTAACKSGVLIVGGPTLSGKTVFAIELAERYDAEIVGADSRQVYRDMPVGTAAPTVSEIARVPHHLIGFVDPYERYSAARYVEDASRAIAAIHARGKRAIVVGGTGFYLRALCGEVNLAAEPDPAIRARLLRETQTHPIDVLHDWLMARDPRRAVAVSPRDPYRIVRALEIDLARAAHALAQDERVDRSPPPRALPTLRAYGIPYVKLALRTDPVQLAHRIGERSDAMLAGGLIEEAERIGDRAIAADAVGYREALAYCSGWLTFQELRATLSRATRRYAKRQLTWFRAERDVKWIDATDGRAVAAAIAAIGWEPVGR